MGGKLLQTERISKDKYHQLVQEITTHLILNYQEIKFHFPRNLKTKQDYGDVDILLFTKNQENVINPKTDDLFKVTETVKHSEKMESFIYQKTQIDFIWFYEREEIFEMAKVWFDYGDLSMLLGVLWKRY